jgi:hypothetical protein
MNPKRAAAHFALGAVLLCALATGCGSETPVSQPSKSPAPPPTTTTSYSSLFTATTSITPSKPPISKPPITTLPDAADGSNLKACRDGQCEVRIGSHAAIAVNAHGESLAFDIEVAQSVITIGIGGATSISTDGDGDAQTTLDGEGMSALGHSGLRVTANKELIEALAVIGSTAVIRLSLT